MYNSSDQNKNLFYVEIKESKLTAKICHEGNGKYQYKDKDGSEYQNCEVSKKDVFQIEILSLEYVHPSIKKDNILNKEYVQIILQTIFVR